MSLRGLGFPITLKKVFYGICFSGCPCLHLFGSVFEVFAAILFHSFVKMYIYFLFVKDACKFGKVC